MVSGTFCGSLLLHNSRILTAEDSLIASVNSVEFVKSVDPREARSLSRSVAKTEANNDRSFSPKREVGRNRVL